MTTAVIGAGIVGVSTAIWLQRAGEEVILIDREGPAAGTSYGNAGILASSFVVPITTPSLWREAPLMLLNPKSPLFMRWSYLPKIAPWLIRFMAHANKKDAVRTAHAMSHIIGDSVEQHLALAEGTGAERYIETKDVISIYPSRAAFEDDGFSWQLRRECGFDWQEVEPEQLDDPFFDGFEGFALRLLNHGHISDPGLYVTALFDHFIAKGGTFHKGAVTDIKGSSDNMEAIITDSGDVACKRLVVAAGAWSKPLAKKLQIDVPLETERGYHIELVNPSIMPKTPIMVVKKKFAMTPMGTRLRCAGTVELGGLEAEPSSAPTALLEGHVRSLFPNLTFERIDHWMGHRPTLSDSLPAIGTAKNFNEGYLAFGHHHLGLTGGPKTGRLIAEMISGGRPNIDMSAYDPNRF